MDALEQIEKNCGEEFPKCVIRLLKECGYCTSATLHEFTQDDIAEMEKFIEINCKDLISKLNCCNATSYKNQKVFKFLPAHRKFVLSLNAKYQKTKNNSSASKSSIQSNTIKQFSQLLQTLMGTAQQNVDKIPTQYRYDETIRYFAMYIYMICGKMCYETLSSNLPLPKASTVRK